MDLHIKFMVSRRCKMLVRSELLDMGHRCLSVELGLAETETELNPTELTDFNQRLLKSGLEILDNKKLILVEKIKTIIIEMIHYSDEDPNSKINDSEYLSETLGYDYNYLSHTFSEAKGITIQQFIILHKIERVKELLLYDELSLTEISYKLHYSSVAHLSNQFKKITSLSPSYFKEIRMRRNQNLEDL